MIINVSPHDHPSFGIGDVVDMADGNVWIVKAICGDTMALRRLGYIAIRIRMFRIKAALLASRILTPWYWKRAAIFVATEAEPPKQFLVQTGRYDGRPL